MVLAQDLCHSTSISSISCHSIFCFVLSSFFSDLSCSFEFGLAVLIT